MFLKGFYHIIDILKAEAVDKWKTYNLTYSRLYQFTQILKRIQVNDPDSRVLLSHIQRETATTLKEFFIKIRGFEKYLGPSRDRRSFLGAIQKIRWSMRLPKLDELCTKLESQVAHANFCLVAQGKFWDGKRGRELIVRRQYVLYNVTTEQELLPSSPCIKPLKDVISPNDRVDMSVIFSSDNLYSKKCPFCRARRSKESRSWVKFTCKSCGFWIHFRDSFDDEPDPLTWTALCEIRESSFREFIREGELFMDMKGFLNPKLNKSQLKKLIIQTWPVDTEDPQNQECPNIRDFLRVTQCQAQWSSARKFSTVLKTHKALREAMSGVRKHLDIIDRGTGLLFDDFSRMIGGRFGRKIPPEYENLVRSIWTYYRDRKTGVVSSDDLLRILKVFSECLLDSHLLYHPYCLAAVRIRCFLWIIFTVLDLEAKTLFPISKSLAQMYPTNAEFMELPLFAKIVSPLFVPNILIARFTFDLADDIKALVSPNEPQYEFAAVCRILQESRTLWLHFLSEGNLDDYDLDLKPECFFNHSIFTSQRVLDNWLEKYRCTLEGILARSGRDKRASSIW